MKIIAVLEKIRDTLGNIHDERRATEYCAGQAKYIDTARYEIELAISYLKYLPSDHLTIDLNQLND